MTCFLQHVAVSCSSEGQGAVLSARAARIRPDQQVIQSQEQLLREWSHVGPFLGIQGKACLRPRVDENTVTNLVTKCVEEQEIFAEAHCNPHMLHDVAERVPGAGMLLPETQVRSPHSASLIPSIFVVEIYCNPNYSHLTQPPIRKYYSVLILCVYVPSLSA